jgi:ribosomal protein S18 acetylase RimI-like enzyme
MTAFISITENEQRDFRIAAHRETSRLTYGESLSDEKIENELAREVRNSADSESSVILYDNDIPVGLVMLAERERDGEQIINVNFFYVKSSNRGKGYGKELVKYSDKYTRNRGYDKYFLRVSDINENAIEFYEHNGFERVEGRDIQYNGVTEFLYVRNLNN